jgi:hypothetical protein
MTYNAVEGNTYKCSTSSLTVYRYTEQGELRHYQNPEIASSWDPKWTNHPVIACDGIPRGSPMAYNGVHERPTVLLEASNVVSTPQVIRRIFVERVHISTFSDICEY